MTSSGLKILNLSTNNNATNNKIPSYETIFNYMKDLIKKKFGFESLQKRVILRRKNFELFHQSRHEFLLRKYLHVFKMFVPEQRIFSLRQFHPEI